MDASTSSLAAAAHSSATNNTGLKTLGYGSAALLATIGAVAFAAIMGLSLYGLLPTALTVTLAVIGGTTLFAGIGAGIATRVLLHRRSQGLSYKSSQVAHVPNTPPPSSVTHTSGDFGKGRTPVEAPEEANATPPSSPPPAAAPLERSSAAAESEVISEVSSKLSVTEALSREWKTIAEIADTWIKSANEKYLTIHGGKMPLFKTRDAASSDIGGLFINSRSMISQIKYQLTTPIKERISGGEPWDTVLICRDSNNNLQAIALFDKRSNKLSYLATNPDNIRHELNEGITTRVQGAGTQIMLSLAKFARTNSFIIRLRATDETVKFYQKLGFEDDPENRGPYDGYVRITSMKLTPQKVKELMSQKISPYDRLIPFSEEDLSLSSSNSS